MNAIQVRDLIQSLKSRQRNIDQIEQQVCAMGSAWISEVILQGQELLKLKENCPHGTWEKTCEKVGLSSDKAWRYMRVAAYAKLVPEIKSAGSLRQALALIAEKTGGDKGSEVQRWPAYIEALGRYSKFVGLIERAPLEQWPKEGLERLKEQMLPTAQKLWPDVKFE